MSTPPTIIRDDNEEKTLTRQTNNLVGLTLSVSERNSIIRNCLKQEDRFSDGVKLSREYLENFDWEAARECICCSEIVSELEDVILNGPLIDIPIRDREWAKEVHCLDNHHDGDCSVYQLVDWKFSKMENNYPSENFMVNSRNFIRGSIMALNLQTGFERFGENIPRKFKKSLKEALKEIKGNPYVIYLTNMRDDLIAPLGSEDELFHNLYALRKKLGLNGDYGYLSKSDFKSEVGDEHFGQNMWDKVKEYLPFLKDGTMKLVAVVREIINKVFSYCETAILFAHEAIGGVLKKFKKHIEHFVLKIIAPEEWIHNMKDPEFCKKVLWSITYLMLVIGLLANLLGHLVGKLVLNTMVYSYKRISERFTSESTFEVLSLVAGMCTIVYGLTNTDTEKVVKKCRFMMTSMAGGTVLMNSAAVLFCLLPTVIKTSLTYKFGGEEARIKFEATQWKNLSLALLALSKTSTVVGTKIYAIKVKEMMKEGSRLLNVITKKAYLDLRMIIGSVYFKLLSLHTILVQKHYSAGPRRLPFSFHISGTPGVGKSLIANKLAKDAFDFEDEDVYSRNATSEYWDAFSNQPLILMDEFLVGPPEDRTKIAQEYLFLISTTRIMPNMASVDSPFVGMKGTTAEPHVVISMNNNPYDRPQEIDVAAFQRRRQFVLVMERNPKTWRGSENHLDIDKYTDEEIASVHWARFKLLQPQYEANKDCMKAPYMNYKLLVENIRTAYGKHIEGCQKISDNLGGGIGDERPAEDIVNEVLRESFELPSKPADPMTTIASLFTSYKSEGARRKTSPKKFGRIGVEESKHGGLEPDEEGRVDLSHLEERPPRHMHSCCGKNIKHRKWLEEQKWKCHICDKEQDCSSCDVDEVELIDKDVILDYHDHDGVEGVHRHPCIGSNCTRNFVSRDTGDGHEYGLCSDCKRAGKNADTEYWVSRTSGKGFPADTVFENMDEFREVCWQRFLDDSAHIWQAFTFWDFNGSNHKEDSQAWRAVASNFNIAFAISFILAVVTGITSYMTAENKPAMTFSAESEKPKKETKSRKVWRPKITRGSATQSEGLNSVLLAELTICGSGRSIPKTIHVIPIKDRWILTYQHWIDDPNFQFGADTDMTLHYKGHSYSTRCEPSSIVVSQDGDFFLMSLTSPKIPQFRNIVSRFVSESEWKSLESFTGRLEDPVGVRYITAKLASNVSYSHGGCRKELDFAWKYPCHTDGGDCGLPVVISSGPLVNKIVGFHVAGSSLKIHDPKGVATIMFRELLEDCMTSEKDLEEDFVAEGTSDVYLELKNTTLPNLRDMHRVKLNERLHMPTRTKLRPSKIHGLVGVEPKKQPSIMSMEDPRSRGINPVSNALVETLSSEFYPVNSHELRIIRDIMFKNLNDKLIFPFGRRELSFEEACKGVPGHLNSIKIGTSPGYPLVHSASKKGKTDFVSFDENGELVYNPQFEVMVRDKIREMENFQVGDKLDHRFVGYLKDELVSQKKIDNVSTRITYANSIISLVAFRMKFGCILAAFQSSAEVASSCIGINQYSYDMQMLYDKLTRVGKEFIAGDFKKYDKRTHPQFRDIGFEILGLLADTYGISPNVIRFMYEHETQSPAQMCDILFTVVSTTFSGGFWTTIINCIINEAYWRWCFMQEYPGLDFDQNVDLTVLGDDHIEAHSINVKWNPKIVAAHMVKIGQEYTSAFKERELEDHCDKFEDIMFLGAIPRLLRGVYTGALKKETLYETIQWTRDRNFTLHQTVSQMFENASQWDEKFFEKYVFDVREAYFAAGIIKDFPEPPPYSALSAMVAKRGLYEHHRLRCDYVSEGPKDPMAGGRVQVTGLTSINTSDEVTTEPYVSTVQDRLASLAINEKALDINYGLQSLMKRDTVSWSSVSGAGTVLWDKAVPWGLLPLGNTANIQNMPFENFIYFVTDVELVFQVNGTPAQAGSLLVYHVPLSATTPGLNNVTTYNSIYLSPNDNTTRSLIIPFRFWRSAMNTYAGELGTESLGNVKMSVLSPLVSNAATTANITVFTRFVAKFSMPRPVPAAEAKIEAKNKLMRHLAEQEEEFVSEGNSTSISNQYSYSNITGDIPSQMTIAPSSSTAVDANASMALPLDNPPMSGGAVPTFGTYSSMSKSNGVEPTVSMQFHQSMMHREQLSVTDPSETRISDILARRSFYNTYSWADTDATGAVKMDIPMNSMFQSYVYNAQVPRTVAILNKFARWRGDIILEFLAVRTVFHSGRLLATIGYGAPAIAAGEENIFLNQVLEFNGDNSWAAVKIPYNSATEFLRTYDGPGAPEQVQDYSLGQFKLTVANPLRSTSAVVASTIAVLAFIRFENVRVYEMKPVPIIQMVSNYPGPALALIVGPEVEEEFKSEGPTDGKVVTDADDAGDTDQPTVVEATASESNVQDSKPCKLNIGRKYEYCIDDIHEVLRRHVKVNMRFQWTTATVVSNGVTYNVYQMPVIPLMDWAQNYAAWSGHLKYRIFIETTTPVLYAYMPTGVDFSDYGGATNGLNYAWMMADGGKQTSTWDVTRSIENPVRTYWSQPWEVAYPVSGSTAMIDISIPFNTHLNFLPTTREDSFGILTPKDYNFFNGWLVLRTSSSAVYPEVYQAAGDDFRLQIWRPLGNSTMTPATGSGGTYDPETDLGGNIVA